VEFSERKARLIELEREEWLHAAVFEERARIARELHDVVAHGVSLMGVQAGAARLLLDDDRARAEQALLAVESTARESVLELRRLLGILRDRDDAASLDPQPGLDQLEPLAEQMRRAGLRVELVIEGNLCRSQPGSLSRSIASSRRR
jgi:signal transduction histidine kinase